mmetsp:Transcript_27395/g.60210  ORF Transcript_27395/g.60210 Transcript_27395/m.60210 type:complete len:278 (+) Transcript_27395:64-897(+)
MATTEAPVAERSAAEVAEAAAFAAATQKLKANPAQIHKPDLTFLKEYVLSLGCKLPPAPAGEPMQIDLSDSDDGAAKVASPRKTAAEAFKGVEDIADSDDDDGERLSEEKEVYPRMPRDKRPDEEVSEAQQTACTAAKAAAAEALEAGDVEGALRKYTEAIMTGAASALLYVKRAELLLEQRRPCAAINDCSAAIEVNPDCGKAFRIKGIAERRLGRWEAAHRDLALGQKLDYDEGTSAIQKLVDEKARKIEERRSAASAQAPTRKRRRLDGQTPGR